MFGDRMWQFQYRLLDTQDNAVIDGECSAKNLGDAIKLAFNALDRWSLIAPRPLIHVEVWSGKGRLYRGQVPDLRPDSSHPEPRRPSATPAWTPRVPSRDAGKRHSRS
jgi:hypothetical protein